MKTLVVNEIDLHAFYYYVESGKEFDNDNYQEFFGYRFNSRQLKKINELSKNLQSGEFLRVEHSPKSNNNAHYNA